MGCEKNLDPKCVRYVGELQEKVRGKNVSTLGVVAMQWCSSRNSGVLWSSGHRSLIRSLKQSGDTKTARQDDWRNLPFRKYLKTMIRVGSVGTLSP